ncbi:hypothetical protein [Maridesulfovibrio sp.]|nr:hypothetical protein [Maridesulfovibrio sp.]
MMENMYSNPYSGVGKLDALRKAQLEVRNNRFGHPYYRAAFQLTGAR